MIFLHGGGDDPHSRANTFGRFVQAATFHASCDLALVISDDSETEAQQSFHAYREIFASLPNAPAQIHAIFVTAAQPLKRTQLERIRPSGVFVCGGVTPRYHQALCLEPSWISYLQDARIPYGGTSAGAAVAARKAIIGGWQATRHGIARAMLFKGASEGLDPITVQDGLGLVPFSIDVHASQMGTLTRLIHAVELDLLTEGWAIDENTVLQVEGDEINIFGQGHVYRVWREGQQPVQITIHVPGEKAITAHR